MIHIAICEDEVEHQEKIKAFIEMYDKIYCCSFDVSFFCSAEDFWENYQVGSFNIVFLDIYLSHSNGIDIAKKLRISDEKTAIVFITSSRDFAIEGFELKAQHYLIKPITKEQIFEALNRCEKMIVEDLKHIILPYGKLEKNIRFKDIIYIEVFDKISNIHTLTENVKTYLPLSQLETQLGGNPFLRCHRSSIINMNYVDNYTALDFIMTNGDTVAIRKSGSVEIRQKYLDFVFNKVREDKFFER